MIYLNHASTTPVKPGVVEAIAKAMNEDWFNPNDLYGTAIRKKIDEAREIVAQSINAFPDEIVFTSSGSAANALALTGSCVSSSCIEHSSILDNPCVSGRLKVNNQGIIKSRLLFSNLYSVMMANNEIGTINDVKELAHKAHKRKALFHTDAVQYFPYYKIDVNDLDVDLLSISGHKIGAPAGIGALYIKRGIEMFPLVHGSQEKGLFAGTENTYFILGLAEAIKLMDYSYTQYIEALRDYFEEKIEQIPCCTVNGKGVKRIPVSNVLFKGYDAQILQTLLHEEDIYVATGSACNAHSKEASHVLKAIGLKDDAFSCLRFSFGAENTFEEIDYVIDRLKFYLSLLG